MATIAVRLVLQAAGWLVHACGLLLVGTAAALLAAAWPLGNPPGMSVVPYERLEGDRLRQLWVSPGGRAMFLWGEMRARPQRPPRQTHVYASLGRDRFRNPGRWFEASYAETRETAAGGRPVLEYTSVEAHWGFIAAVGLAVAALPLAVRPSRVAIVGAYRRAGLASLTAASRLRAFVPIRSGGSRGFEVISR